MINIELNDSFEMLEVAKEYLQFVQYVDLMCDEQSDADDD
jgi:hypothetical protein